MKPRSVQLNVDSGNKTWLTPRSILDHLGDFDLDPCCPENMPWKTATRMVTPQEDGLTVPWRGRVWLNPPYGREATPFLQKMKECAIRGKGRGIALVFARTETKMWQDLIFPYAYGICFLRGRVSFCDIQGDPVGTSTMPSALIAYSWEDKLILEAANEQHFGGSFVQGERSLL